MDIETFRTLLEVNRTRHFGKAAEELFITQSAVSARIKKLEENLGVTLLDRKRRDIHPTPEGRRLLRHAEHILALWRKARQDVALSEKAQAQLAVGGVVSLWDVRLQEWSHRVHQAHPELSLILEAYGHDRLMRRMIDGVLDMVYIYEPPQLEEFMIEQVASISLIMVSSLPDQSTEEAFSDYVMVDWGQIYALQHARHFPDAPAPAQRVSQGTIALNFILACGGAAYLAEQTVNPFLTSGRLHRVKGAPVIERSAFAVFPRRSGRLELIRQVIPYFDTE